MVIGKFGLSTKLLAEINRRLDAFGLIVKRGTLVDTTLLAGAARRPYEDGGVNPRDPEARFTRKRDKTYFGLEGASGGGRGKRAGAPCRDDLG